jgi:hypothetical protein
MGIQKDNPAIAKSFLKFDYNESKIFCDLPFDMIANNLNCGIITCPGI